MYACPDELKQLKEQQRVAVAALSGKDDQASTKYRALEQEMSKLSDAQKKSADEVPNNMYLCVWV
jgi:peptidoglycan hydrolase CwlO-like protein